MNRFRFGDSDESASDFDDDPSQLPFPEPISRSFFLAPDFEPATFLSSLKNRHQALEDLRQELRNLDQLLSKELLDLVNEKYQDFLSLGNTLRGGEEKVEDVRVGLLAFQKDVQAIRDKVDSRRKDVQSLLTEKKRLREQINFGKTLIDYADRIDELEHRLMTGDPYLQQREDSNAEFEHESDVYSSETDESDAEQSVGGGNTVPLVSLRRLEHHIQKYVYLTRLSAQVGSKHPFIVSQQPRMSRIRSALLLDLRSALEQAKQAGDKKDSKTLSVMRLYNSMGEDTKAVDALKSLNLTG